MQTAYQTRRAELQTYFDETASVTWQKLTSNAPVSGIRATVRAGREATRYPWRRPSTLRLDRRGTRPGRCAWRRGGRLGWRDRVHVVAAVDEDLVTAGTFGLVQGRIGPGQQFLASLAVERGGHTAANGDASLLSHLGA